MTDCACQHPDPETALLAYQQGGTMDIEDEVLDDSHFRVYIQRCRECGRLFVAIFTEVIDWEDGCDPQARAFAEIDEETAKRVRAAKDETDWAASGAFGISGRILYWTWPSDEPACAGWKEGPLMILPHS